MLCLKGGGEGRKERRGEGERADGKRTECSAMKNRGVNEAFAEAARVALSVKGPSGSKSDGKCAVM